MNFMKKAVCMLLAVVLAVGLLPATVFAAEEDVVYLSISFDKEYINDKNGKIGRAHV